MRLAVVSPFLDRRHGTELCIIEQIGRLTSQHGWEIHVYSQKVEDVEGIRPAANYQKDSPGRIFWHKVPALPGPHLLNYLWWFIANHWLRWRDKRTGRFRPDLLYSPGINCLDADVIVVHIVFHGFQERARRQLNWRRIPMRNWPLLIHRKLYYRLIMFLERKLYANPNLPLIAVSSLVAEQVEACSGRIDVKVIRNAVDTLGLTPERRLAHKQECRQLFHFADEDFVVLFIGNDWKKKGFDPLLKALAQLEDLPWRLLVRGTDDLGLYRSLLASLGVEDRIRFEKSRPEVLPFYAAADLYVAPSLEDGFNLPVIEAMSCGLPVVASRHMGASELIRDGETGLILDNPQNDELLARLIRRLYEDLALRRTMGGAASEFVRANCGWQKNVEQTREFLDAVLQARRRN